MGFVTIQQRVSIIIPVYNVERYIDECITSIMAQEYKNYEVIMVDDGSTDSSGKKCDEYAEKDSKVQVIHTENNGIAAARNLAMEKMTGEFCFFLDPDDVIETDTLGYMVKTINDYKADLVLAVTRQFSGPYTVAEHSKPLEHVYEGHKNICEQVLFDKNDLKPLAQKGESSQVTYEFFSCLYRTELLKKYNIQFLPISYGEDTYVCFKSLLTSYHVVTSSKIVYSHRRNPTSTTFQYHPFYLDETKKYYDFYIGLFEEYAPEYLKRGQEGLNGQYFRRCCAAIERELIMSPANTPISDQIKTVALIRKDTKFRELITWNNIAISCHGFMKWIMLSVKTGLYPFTVFLFHLLHGRVK